MSQINVNMTSPMTPIRQIKKVSIEETPNAPLKNKMPSMNINVEIPKFNVNFDEDHPSREHETRLHRKTSYWSDETLNIPDKK